VVDGAACLILPFQESAMKRFTLITVTVLSVATFFGLPWVLGHLNAAKQVAKDHIDQNVPIEMTQARINSQIQKDKQALLNNQVQLAEAQDTHLLCTVELKKLRELLAREEAALRQAVSLLREERTHYELNGHRFTLEQIKIDANQRADQLEKLRQSEATQDKQLQQLVQRISEGQSDIVQAKWRLANLETELTLLVQRHRINDGLNLPGLNMAGLRVSGATDAEIEVDKLRKQVEREERRQSIGRQADRSPQIDFESISDLADRISRQLPASPASDLADTIDASLNNPQPAPAPSLTTPTPRASR